MAKRIELYLKSEEKTDDNISGESYKTHLDVPTETEMIDVLKAMQLFISDYFKKTIEFEKEAFK